VKAKKITVCFAWDLDPDEEVDLIGIGQALHGAEGHSAYVNSLQRALDEFAWAAHHGLEKSVHALLGDGQPWHEVSTLEVKVDWVEPPSTSDLAVMELRVMAEGAK
jgi:hypothetical protein